jgi:hypothetical protein
MKKQIAETQTEIDITQKQYVQGLITLEEKLIKMIEAFNQNILSLHQQRVAEYIENSLRYDSEPDQVLVAVHLLRKEQELRAAKSSLNFYILPEKAQPVAAEDSSDVR